MKVKTDENKIVLTDLPLERWLFGLVFSMVGLQAVLPAALSGLAASGIKELFWALFTALFGGVFVVAGYVAGLSAVYQRITIDRWLKSVTIKEIGLLHFGTTCYPAGEIDKIYSESETDSEDSKSHTICLTLKSGRSITLGMAFASRAECETVVKTAETFLEKLDFSDKRQKSVVDGADTKLFKGSKVKRRRPKRG